MSGIIERMLKSGKITLDELKAERGRFGPEFELETEREVVWNTAERALSDARWPIDDIYKRGGGSWEVRSGKVRVTVNGERIQVRISYMIRADTMRNIEVTGYSAGGRELGKQRVSRLVSPRDAGRQLSP